MLVRAIRQMQAGEDNRSGCVQDRLAPHRGSTYAARDPGSPIGRSGRSFADETVRMQMKNIMGKLGANDPAHAVTIAAARGIRQLLEVV